MKEGVILKTKKIDSQSSIWERIFFVLTTISFSVGITLCIYYLIRYDKAFIISNDLQQRNIPIRPIIDKRLEDISIYKEYAKNILFMALCFLATSLVLRKSNSKQNT